LAPARWRPGLSAAAALRGRERDQFLGSGQLDIGDDGWKILANESGVKVDFTDNGNDPGPVVARLAAGKANDITMWRARRRHREELRSRGFGSRPGILAQIPNYSSVVGMGEGHPALDLSRQGLRHSDRRNADP